MSAARQVELRSALLIVGALVLLAVIFYAGRKFESLRYYMLLRRETAELAKIPDKYPDVPRKS